ncbi:MAG: hypothetical protein NWE92_07970 [Candidatus Bathyarchaeota archaeon]|nr:hypothetical protein [Candidatus Bathyarchaeota archaeon]
MLKDENILAVGMLSLTIGILIGTFSNFEYLGFNVSSFLEGLLLGLSLVMNFAYLVRRRRKA